jgi:PAS domain S-box-containing protein
LIARIKHVFFGNVRRRLIFGVALVHAVVMSAFIWDLNFHQQRALLDQQEEQARFLAKNISLSAAGWLASRDVAGLQEIISAQSHGRDIVYAMALDSHGKVLAHTDIERVGQYVTDLPAKAALTVLYDKPDLVDVVSPVALGNNQVGWIRVGIGQTHAHSQLVAVTRDGIIYTIFAILVGTVVAFLIGTRLTRRLHDIGSTADAIVDGKTNQRVPVEGTDETEQLASRFNDMLDVIENSKEALRKTNRELLSKEQMLSQSQAIAKMGSWIYDHEQDLLTWSDETYKIFGVSPNNVDKLSDIFWGMIHEADFEHVEQAFLESLQPGGTEYEIEHRIIRKSDGCVRYVHEKCVNIWDESGKAVRSIGVVQDVTDKVEADSRITENELRLSAVMKTASDGIHIVSPDGTLIEASDSFLHERGYDQSALGHLKVWEWDPNLSRDKIEGMIESLIGTSQSKVFETLHRHRDGNDFWVEVHARGVNIMGKDMIFAAARDVTERKQAEAERERLQVQLVQSQKMEAVGQLTGGIAHDFNNILGAMLGYAQLLQYTGAENTTANQKEYIHEILTAGNRAKELITQMLVFSRAQPESNGEDTPVVLLLPLLKEVVQLMKSSIPSGIEVGYSMEDEDLRACIEPVHLHQILVNLVINARDAIDEYGTIDISAYRKTITSYCSACHEDLRDEYVVISVTDTGSGIALDAQSKIFDPFFTTKAVGKGTGMGLSVVHGLVHAIGGHIQVNSQAGAGTTIGICLPVIQPGDAEARSLPVHDTNERGEISGLKVMLVDDEVMLCQMWGEVLGHHGADVSIFTSPVEALRAFEQNPEGADLVITDQNMPELSGSEMAKSMLRLRKDLPVILCTGHAENIDEEKAKEIGMVAFMSKPVDIKELLIMLKDLGLADRAPIGPNNHA